MQRSRKSGRGKDVERLSSIRRKKKKEERERERQSGRSG